MKHTPGPWHVDPGFLFDVVASDGRDVAETHLSDGHERPDDERWANAILIAAAPDMLRALEAASHALRCYQYGNGSPELAESVADHADKIIARAKGGA